MTDLTARQSARKFNAAKTVYVVGSLASIGIVVALVAASLALYVAGREVPEDMAKMAGLGVAFLFGAFFNKASDWLE